MYLKMGIQDPHPLNFADLKDTNIHIDTKTLSLGAILLLLILISTLSLIYFLYICIRRSRLAAAVSPQLPPPPPPPPAGLDKDTISCLPIVSYGSSCHVITNFSSKMGECSICLGAFYDGEKVKILPTCHHGFHSDCVDTWLLTRSSCPLCRACVAPVDSVLNSDIP